MHKILSTLLIFSLSLGFLSCSSDKDKEPAVERFVWNGDWNDPSDPNYKEGGYNPLANTYWSLDKDPTLVFRYTYNFEMVRYNYDPVTNELKRQLTYSTYIINDTGFKDTDYGYHAYKLQGGKMYSIQLGIETPITDDMWSSYTRCRPKNG